MAHVFEGQPDGRQADTAIKVSRFRPQYRALTDEEKALHDEIKSKAAELEVVFEKVKNGRYKHQHKRAVVRSTLISAVHSHNAIKRSFGDRI